MRVYGRNVFNELDPSKIKKVYISKNLPDTFFQKIKDNKLFYEIMDNSKLNHLVKGNHQGIVMEVNDFLYEEIDNILDSKTIVILDHLNDPHNFGAIIRTCEAFGIESIIIPRNRSVTVNDTVIKVSTGAIERVKIVMINNINQAIDKLKKNKYFIYGTDMEGIPYYDVSYTPKRAIVIGSEGDGISDLTAKSCDEIISIPMKGEINSLNASVAAGVIISYIARL